MFSTYSNEDYDRRNEDVDPMAASAEYELEKRVERLELFPVELEKGERQGEAQGSPLWCQPCPGPLSAPPATQTPAARAAATPLPPQPPPHPALLRVPGPQGQAVREQRSRLSMSLYTAVGARQGQGGHYDSTWTRVTGVPKQVMLALSSEDGN